MTYRSGIVTGIALSLVVLGSAQAIYFFATAKVAAPASTSTSPAPATVVKTLKEDQINSISLTREAMERLNLRTVSVEMKPVRRVRVYGGEVIVPPGQTIAVSAPLSGTLKAPLTGAPQPGQAVRKGQRIFQLLPLLAPEGRINLATAQVEAEGQCQNAVTQFDQTQKALDRAKNLFKTQAGSKRGVEEAQMAYDVAKKNAEQWKARCELLRQVVGEIQSGTTSPMDINCPADGVLRNLSALPGQYVPSGAALFEVASLKHVWVRIPVYVGDQPEIDVAADAGIGNVTGRGDELKQPAKPVAAPPSGNASAGTVDVFYELDNSAGRFSPGERVGAKLQLRGDSQHLTVPWSAVVYDLYGGTWVYRQVGERQFVRERVIVRYINDDTAVLAIGPAPGSKVVIAGAAELFGAETGFTK